MKKIRIEFLSEGFHDLLMSDEIAGLVKDSADDIAEAAKSASASSKAEYEVKGPKPGGFGGGRMIAYVATENSAAYYDNIRNHTLERAVWEARK